MQNNPSRVLHKAEMCWRQHHITMISMALAYDLTNILAVETGAQSLKEIARILKPVELFLELSDLLRDSNLVVHPLVSGRTDITDKAAELTKNKEFIATNMEIIDYFSFDSSQKIDAIKKAIIRYPDIKRLYYFLGEYKPVKHRISILYKIDNLRFDQETPDEIFFTELGHMAIGHLGGILDILSILKVTKGEKKITISETPESACETMINYAYSINLAILENTQRVDSKHLLEMPINQLSKLYCSCNPSHVSFTSSQKRKAANSQYNHTEVNKIKGKAIMHLRTGNYKYNDQAKTMKIRSVVPSSYQRMVSIAKLYDYIITNATADFEPMLVKGAKLLHVTDKSKELMQWKEYLNSEFMIGTQSGISHLTILCNHKVLLTNYTALPYDHMLLTNHSLVACKRINLTNNILHYSRLELLSLFMNQWGHEANNLSSIVEVTDLSEDELVRAFEEFIQLSMDKIWSYTLYGILDKYNLSHLKIILPDTNLFSTTYKDFDKIMSYADSSVHR